MALEAGILMFNVESVEELQAIGPRGRRASQDGAPSRSASTRMWTR